MKGNKEFVRKRGWGDKGFSVCVGEGHQLELWGENSVPSSIQKEDAVT